VPCAIVHMFACSHMTAFRFNQPKTIGYATAISKHSVKNYFDRHFATKLTVDCASKRFFKQ